MVREDIAVDDIPVTEDDAAEADRVGKGVGHLAHV